MIGMTAILESFEWKEWLLPRGRKERCPSPKNLLQAARKGNSFAVNRRTLDHVARCESCSRDFRFVLDILREEQQFKTELDAVTAERLNLSSPREIIRPRPYLSPLFRFACYSLSVLLLMCTLSMNSSVFAGRAPSNISAIADGLQGNSGIDSIIQQYLAMVESRDDVVRYECFVLGDSIVIRIFTGIPDNPESLIVSLLQ